MTVRKTQANEISNSSRQSDFPVLTQMDAIKAGANGLPFDLPNSSYDILVRSAADHRDQTALSSFTDVATFDQLQSLTYQQLLSGVTQTANMLFRAGITSDDVIGLIMPNMLEAHLALWGAEATGVVMPLNPMLEPAVLAKLLTAAKAKALICVGDEEEIVAKIEALLPSARTIEHVYLVKPTHDAIFRIQMCGDHLERVFHVHSFDDEQAREPGNRLLSNRVFSPDDRASYFCTGGTTGLPKIAVRTHGQVIADCWMTSRMLGPALTHRSKLFCGLPLFHVNAVVITGLLPFLLGASVVIGTRQGYRAAGLVQNLWRIAEYHQITAFSCVPTILSSLLDCPVSAHDLSSLRFVICGAAPLSSELLTRFEQESGVAVCEGYGLTESCCVASLNPVDGEHRAGSVGFALPCSEIRIVSVDEDATTCQPAKIGEIGAIAISGPHIFSGYLSSEHNASTWFDMGDQKRWLNTGDLGRLDDEGYLWLTGRSKDLIIRGGHNIDPSIIEEALYLHPDVAQAAAVGRPDARLGEVPVAYVQLRQNANISVAELEAHVAKHIGERAASPKAITILDALPLTAVGKVHKPTLRSFESARVARASLERAGVSYVEIVTQADGLQPGAIGIFVTSLNEAEARQALGTYHFPYTFYVVD